MRKLLKYALATTAMVAMTAPKGIGAIHNVSAKLDSTNLLLGNVTTLHIQAVADGTDGHLLLSDDTITSAVEYRAIDYKGATALSDGTNRLDYDVTIQVFDSGPHPIPPIPFVQGIDTAYSNSLQLTVNPPLNADTIKDVTASGVDVLDPPDVHWTDDLPEPVARAVRYWPWILAAVVLIAAAVAAYIIYKRRKAKVDEEQQLPPYQWAMLKLQAIRERKLYQSGHERQFYTDLTEILRIYIMRRFDINALKMTSSQILKALPTHITGVKEGKKVLKHVLQPADFVKFAKYTPIVDDNIKAFNNAVQFVELTRPVIEVEQPTDEKQGDQDTQPQNTTPSA